MGHIFISYSRRDAEYVDAIIKRFEKAGLSVWVDRGSIQGGDQWKQEIVEGIEKCEAFILVLSSTSVRSDNVRRELDLAGEYNKKIIPIQLSPTIIPRGMKYQLVGVQRIDMVSDFEVGIKQLLYTLSDPLLDLPKLQPSKPVSHEKSTSKKKEVSHIFKKAGMLFISILGLIAIAIYTILFVLANIKADRNSFPTITHTDTIAPFHPEVPATATPTATAIPSPTIETTLANDKIAFASDKEGEFSIYILDAQSGLTGPLLKPSGYNRTWWPTFCGNRIAMETSDQIADRPQWIYLLDLDTNNLASLIDTTTTNFTELGIPRCSADGRYISFSANSGDSFWHMYIYDTYQEISPVHVPVPEGYANVYVSGYASWSKYNNIMAYMIAARNPTNYFVLEMGNYPQLKVDYGFSGSNPSISPDGSQISFSCYDNLETGSKRYLCVSDLYGQKVRRIHEIVRVEVKENTHQPHSAWSSDGEWIYFASAEDGDWDIYRIRPDGTEIENLTDHLTGNEIHPAVQWK